MQKLRRLVRGAPLVASAILGLCAGRPAGAAPASPDAAGPVIAAGDPFFSALFRRLAAEGSIRSAFTEYRWFPFRAEPVALRGEMRFSRSLGLSLHYPGPDDRTVIADSSGLLVRDARGGSRAVEPDARAPDLGRTLLPILRFDGDELFADFRVRAVRSGNAWRVDFTPKDDRAARLIGVIVVTGEAAAVRRIEFRRSASRRIEIRIDSTQTGVHFGRAERARYFR